MKKKRGREVERERERKVLGVYLVPVVDEGGAGTGGHGR